MILKNVNSFVAHNNLLSSGITAENNQNNGLFLISNLQDLEFLSDTGQKYFTLFHNFFHANHQSW